MKRISLIQVVCMFLLCNTTLSQQVADSAYSPEITNPAYTRGKGPLIYIDEGHYNFHTKDGRYLPFARVLEKDGYRTEGYKGSFDAKRLKKAGILVISNALNEANTQNWYLPNPSAFTPAEIETVRKWVNDGGSLFLIADHMPMAGAAADLASAFGFTFYNGFALDTSNTGPAFFRREDKLLCDNRITNGRNGNEKVNTAVTFTGQAFSIPEKASSILTFNKKYTIFMPDTAWVFNSSTRTMSASGLSQGAFMNYGQGKVVIFGEAAMFTAQLAGPGRSPAGMNSPFAAENYKLLLNIIHWLDE